MAETKKSSSEILEEYVQALIDEGIERGEFEIDSMRFARMEMVGHLLGKDLSRQIQAKLAERQGERMASSYDCPRCGRLCQVETEPKSITSLDGPIDIPESRCFCKTCRKSFFPSA